ncbi:hypothetical protein [Methylobacterium soli]|uniref:Uncharacterized protein n=1 Tax=Methylobacterium soli TaxID=553447 RepID=A0A6L3T5Z0_9HYPH|nr:hypothetical protein [Methylobacterium soli]KAB1080719.1 hypothetical protein F6X53_05995 [Methylobacterium soli]GJE46612.1 hypothetical protein AEGHOMDF_5818 [Methylobacterium soli]
MAPRHLRAALFPLAIALFAGAAPIAATPAAAVSPSKSYMFSEPRLRNACRPPLKFAAGACVRRCPAGYQDNGGYCRHRTMRR